MTTASRITATPEPMTSSVSVESPFMTPTPFSLICGAHPQGRSHVGRAHAITTDERAVSQMLIQLRAGALSGTLRAEGDARESFCLVGIRVPASNWAKV